MKIAVISDVHGNRLALEAVLDDIADHKVDSTLNLGDLVSGPMEPNWTADILMDLDIPTVRGNHERVLIDYPPEKLGPVDRFAQEQMEQRHRDWISQLPATLSMLDDIFLCHGTPTSDDEPWLDNWWDGRREVFPDEATVAAKAEGFNFPVLLCGHTHIAACGATQGWTPDRQSGQCRAADESRIAGCALLHLGAARGPVVGDISCGAL